MALVVSVLGFAGCGSSDDDLGTFTGTWMWSPGSTMITCPGLGTDTSMLSGSMIVSRGIDAPLATTVNNGTCTLKLDPSGNSAILRMGQICPPTTGTFSDNTAYTETDTFNTGNFSVNGRVATISLSASAQIVAAGQTLVCSYSITGTLQKSTQ
jgi:hypothetical protein